MQLCIFYNMIIYVYITFYNIIYMYLYIYIGWEVRRVVTVMDDGAEGRRFNSRKSSKVD